MTTDGIVTVRGVQLDAEALKSGASVAALTAVPCGIIGRIVLDDSSRSSWVSLFAFLVLVGLVLGAGVAAWRQSLDAPLTHGIVTAMGVFVVVQLVGIARHLVTGTATRWGVVLSSLLLSLIAGTVGGLLGSFLRRNGAVSSR